MITDLEWIHLAALVARQALCLRSKCGALVVQGSEVLGQGFNGPPLDDLTHRQCGMTGPSKAKPKSDRTCCLHAEWRAIFRSAGHAGIVGSTLYFVRVNASDQAIPSGRPYCTVCSRLALDAGIAHWVLLHADGPRRYDAVEYDRLSHEYDALLASDSSDA